MFKNFSLKICFNRIKISSIILKYNVAFYWWQNFRIPDISLQTYSKTTYLFITIRTIRSIETFNPSE